MDNADRDWLEKLDKENLDTDDPLSLKRALKSMKDSIKESKVLQHDLLGVSIPEPIPKRAAPLNPNGAESLVSLQKELEDLKKQRSEVDAKIQSLEEKIRSKDRIMEDENSCIFSSEAQCSF